MSTQPSFPSPFQIGNPWWRKSAGVWGPGKAVYTHGKIGMQRNSIVPASRTRPCIPMSMPHDHLWIPKQPQASCIDTTSHVSTLNRKATISTYGRNLIKIRIWQKIDKGQNFIPQPRFAARIPLFVWETRTYPQIAVPGTVRHGSEVDVIRVFGTRISENPKIGPSLHSTEDISKGNCWNRPCRLRGYPLHSYDTIEPSRNP